MDMKGAYIMCHDTMKALELFELDGTTTAFQFDEGSVHKVDFEKICHSGNTHV